MNMPVYRNVRLLHAIINRAVQCRLPLRFRNIQVQRPEQGVILRYESTSIGGMHLAHIFTPCIGRTAHDYNAASA
ncbi:hypothetical protein WM40_02180 [Robbsia andropogonis]|uniref:Uncharacterized protein n=1 Tax=Robbsia andropogonis TaxID=28092 RepID=A0A0F5K3Y7_9BURK|nr:hypothetical protein WM40_02180 [Robbsia andropogonis]